MARLIIIWIRRILPFLILLIIILSPLSQLVRTARQDPLPYKESPVLQNEATRNLLFENDIKLKSYLEFFYDDISGGAYSLKIYALKMAEPFTAIAVSTKNIFNTDFWNWQLFFAFLIPILIGVLFGRVYCSYVCPWSLIVNLNLKIRKRIFKYIPQSTASLIQNTPKWRHYYFIGFLILTIFNPIILQYILPASVIQNGVSDIILFGNYTLWILSFFGLLVFEVIKPAFFCRNLCPTGLFLSYLGTLRVFKLGYNRRKSCPKDCHSCIEECWLGLNPKQKAQDPACDLCARCVKVCPTDRLVIEKKKPYKVSVLICFLAFLFIGCVSQGSKNNFGDEIIQITLYENAIDLYEKSDTCGLEASYSFVSDEKTQFDGEGDMKFNLHIRDEDEIFNSPLIIESFRNEKLLTSDTIKQPNRPISIINRSVYQVEIPFTKASDYYVKVASLDNSFNPFEINFMYPWKRF